MLPRQTAATIAMNLVTIQPKFHQSLGVTDNAGIIAPVGGEVPNKVVAMEIQSVCVLFVCESL